MTTKSFFFWGVIEGEPNADETWKVLHDHFEKLAGEDEARTKSGEHFDGKAAKRRK